MEPPRISWADCLLDLCIKAERCGIESTNKPVRLDLPDANPSTGMLCHGWPASGSPGSSDSLAESVPVNQGVNYCFCLRIQPIDTTHCLNRSAGVSKFNVFLGRSLSRLATAFNLACE